MNYFQFGRLSKPISSLGFGTWALGGDSYGPVSDIISTKALKCAFGIGVNFFDTADIYGSGHSEELLGKAFKNCREDVIISTKAGYTDYSSRSQDFSEKYIRKSLNNSLRRLKSEYVDIFFLHSPPQEVILADQLNEVLENLKESGKIKYSGVSVRTPDDGILALRHGNYDFIQVTFNLIELRAIENGLLREATYQNIGLIAKAPLCYGFLTGKYTKDTMFPNNDHRYYLNKEQRNHWIDKTTLFQFLNIDGKNTLAQSALRFCLDYGPAVLAIPGIKTVEQVYENFHTIFTPSLNSDERSRIYNLYRHSNGNLLKKKDEW